MRRFVALIILCMLPVQWSYAAVAEYCQHEEAAVAQNHLGHHAHKHVDDAPDSKGKKGGFVDLDCPSCQHANATAILDLPAAMLPRFSVTPITFLSQSIPCRSPDNPFRPPLAIRL
jgi:hypothetical protein